MSTKGRLTKNENKTFRNIIIVALLLLLSFIGKVFNIDLDALNIGSILQSQQTGTVLEFRNDNLWEEHFIKHGSEFGYSTKEEYLEGANEVVASAYSKHKKEAEDGDDIYYDTENNEINLYYEAVNGTVKSIYVDKNGNEVFGHCE